MSSLTEQLDAALLEMGQEGRDTEMTVVGRYLFPPDFAAFAGHFPGRPLLPAIVQLAAVRHLVGRLLGKPLVLAGADHVKFRGLLGPDEEVTVRGVLLEQDNGWQLSFTVRGEDERIADGRLFLVESAGR